MLHFAIFESFRSLRDHVIMTFTLSRQNFENFIFIIKLEKKVFYMECCSRSNQGSESFHLNHRLRNLFKILKISKFHYCIQ